MDSIEVILLGVGLGTALIAGLAPGPKPPASAGERAELGVQLEAHLSAGRKIDAIKTYRRLTGSGLAEAKAAIEALLIERHGHSHT